MQPSPTKTFCIKICQRCRANWADERVALEPGDRLEIITARIAYCPSCADGFSEEIDRPTYKRTGKKIR